MLDTWAVIVGLAGAVGILWKYVAAQNDQQKAVLKDIIDKQQAVIDKQDTKIDEMHNALKETAAAIVQARNMVESEGEGRDRKPTRGTGR